MSLEVLQPAYSDRLAELTCYFEESNASNWTRGLLTDKLRDRHGLGPSLISRIDSPYEKATLSERHIDLMSITKTNPYGVHISIRKFFEILEDAGFVLRDDTRRKPCRRFIGGAEKYGVTHVITKGGKYPYTVHIYYCKRQEFLDDMRPFFEEEISDIKEKSARKAIRAAAKAAKHKVIPKPLSFM